MIRTSTISVDVKVEIEAIVYAALRALGVTAKPTIGSRRGVDGKSIVNPAEEAEPAPT